MIDLQTINSNLLAQFKNEVNNLSEKFHQLKEAEISSNTFSFYTSVASVFSSKIEGENIDLDSYIKHKSLNILFKPDYTKKTDDLYNAYQFAKLNHLNKQNLNNAHQLLSKNLINKVYQGKFRNENMFITTNDGKIEYVAVLPHLISIEMDKWFSDLTLLLKTKLSFEEILYYASYLHLTFVKIHPFVDGNGRTARLIEKWFIAEHLGDKAWFLQSEKNYYLNHQLYYQNLRKLGFDYAELDYTKALPFLLMLPESLNL
jgi:Fic family protein